MTTETLDPNSADAPVGEAPRQIKSADELPPEEKDAMFAAISAWNNVAKKLAPLIAEEKELRKALFSKYFTAPREGTNAITLGFGKELKAKYPINRKINEEALDAASVNKLITPELLHEVIKYKPSLSVGAYKDLTDDQKKLFADIITEEPGTPALEIFTPKR